MACPASGKITIADLVNEFGGSAPHALSEYYRNGGLVPGNNTNVAESGQISLTDFYAAVNEILHTHSDGDTHANYATIFGSNWASTVPKRVVVPSGVTVGGTSTHAMQLPSGMGGTIVFDITGNVHGHSGAANGGAGGNAIHCVQTSGVTINVNNGASVKAGGGGGGAGGAGGNGGTGGAGGAGGNGSANNYAGNTGNWSSPHCFSSYSTGLTVCKNQYGHGYITSAGKTGSCYYVGTDYLQKWNCYAAVSYSGGAGGAGGAANTSGGAGGAGGVGQGYGVSAAAGSSGASGSNGSAGASGAGGGTSAGTGGTGGTGGASGNGGTGGTGGNFGAAGANGSNGDAGANGNTGAAGANGNSTNGASGASGAAGAAGASGSAGGAAGYYIYNRSSITLNNSGTVAGN